MLLFIIEREETRGAASDGFLDVAGQFLVQGIVLVEIGSAAHQRIKQIPGGGFLFAGLLVRLAIAGYLAGFRIHAHRASGRIQIAVAQLVGLCFLGAHASGIGRFLCPTIVYRAQPAIRPYLPMWSFLLHVRTVELDGLWGQVPGCGGPLYRAGGKLFRPGRVPPLGGFLPGSPARRCLLLRAQRACRIWCARGALMPRLLLLVLVLARC